MALSALADGVEAYKAKHGEYPRSDEASTWTEKMIADGLSGWLDHVLEDHQFVDAWDRPLIYIPPKQGSPPDATPIIRSMGNNGIDDLGEGDDLTHGTPHNIGYYGRKGWVPGIMILILFSLAALALRVNQPVLANTPRRRVISAHTLVALLGLLLAANTASAYYPCASDRALNTVLWLITFAGWPVLAVMSGTWLVLVILDSRQSITMQHRAERGLCTHCAYDRSGIDATWPCPECGASPPHSAAQPTSARYELPTR